MGRAQKVTKSLVCGTCIHCEVSTRNGRKECLCSLFRHRVMSYYPFCEEYEGCTGDIIKTRNDMVIDTGEGYAVPLKLKRRF